MPEPIAVLEAKRSEVVKQISQLGDMRKGSITENFRCCGKPSCGCHATDHARHGPYYAFTTNVAGKTRTVQMRPGAKLKKFEREVSTYKEFRKLSNELIAVNETLCEARPAPDETADRAELKKTSRRSSKRKSRGK